MTIPIALFMGVYLRFLRPGRVSEVSLIGVALLLLAVVSGNWVAQTSWGADWFSLSPVALSWCIIIYGFAASVLPVWLQLEPRDYLSTFMKVGTIVLLAIGILVARPVMEAPAISQFAKSGTGPVFAGWLFPFLFITIACGALSGFHSLISSGATAQTAADYVNGLGLSIASARSRSCRAPVARPRWRSACPRCCTACSAAKASRRSGTTSRSCSRHCSSPPRWTRAPGLPASCCPTG